MARNRENIVEEVSSSNHKTQALDESGGLAMKMVSLAQQHQVRMRSCSRYNP